MHVFLLALAFNQSARLNGFDVHCSHSFVCERFGVECRRHKKNHTQFKIDLRTKIVNIACAPGLPAQTTSKENNIVNVNWWNGVGSCKCREFRENVWKHFLFCIYFPLKMNEICSQVRAVTNQAISESVAIERYSKISGNLEFKWYRYLRVDIFQRNRRYISTLFHPFRSVYAVEIEKSWDRKTEGTIFFSTLSKTTATKPIKPYDMRKCCMLTPCVPRYASILINPIN